MRRGSCCAGVLGFVCAISACSGEEFSSGTGARGGSAGSAASGGSAGTAGSAGSGGSAGSSASGGSGGVGGAAGTGNGGSAGGSGNGGSAGANGGAGGAGGAAASGGTGGSTSACGPVPGKGLSLYTTLNNESAIMTPASGNPASADFNPNDFHSGKCANALMIDEAGEYVQFAEPQNILYTSGTIDFWLRPKTDEFDGLQRTYLESSQFGSKAGVRLRKSGDGGSNAFVATFSDSSGITHETRVSDTAFDYTPNQWIRITVTWNFADTSQAVRVYFDGVEATYAATVVGPLDMSLAVTTGLLFIGNDSPSGTTPANGLIDDFKIYASVVTP